MSFIFRGHSKIVLFPLFPSTDSVKVLEANQAEGARTGILAPVSVVPPLSTVAASELPPKVPLVAPGATSAGARQRLLKVKANSVEFDPPLDCPSLAEPCHPSYKLKPGGGRHPEVSDITVCPNASTFIV